MPAHRKLLPAPCPQCGLENGGCQIVIFNPKLRPQLDPFRSRTNFNPESKKSKIEYNPKAKRYGPIAILRISHYSNEQYKLASKKRKTNSTKIWHNFQIHLPAITRGSESIMLDEIFDDPWYEDEQSITLPMDEGLFNYVKTHGWTGWMKIETQGAHWIKALKQCYGCGMYFKPQLLQKFDYPKGYRVLKYCWLCESCYATDLEKVEKWKQEKPLTHNVHQVSNLF